MSGFVARTFGQAVGALVADRRARAGMTQLELALEAFEDETKIRRIVELENGHVARPQGKILGPLCEVLNITPEEVRELKRSAIDARDQNSADIEALRAEIGSLGEALANVKKLSRDQLEVLAIRFEIPGPHLRSDVDLRNELESKAADYRELRKLVSALDERVASIANLKGAAQDAVERLDFAEVELLLSRVDEIETEIVAETKEARARNALLRALPEQAFDILSSAADSFASVDALEPVRRRLRYEDYLFQYGRRYDKLGLELSERMICNALSFLQEESSPELWGRAQNALAVAYSTQGERTDHKAGIALLEKAIATFRVSLRARSEEKHPQQWAATMQNIANALRHLGERTEGEKCHLFFDEAITSYQNALRVFAPDKHKIDRATTTRNLANALRQKATRTIGVGAMNLFEESLRAFQNVLYEFKKDTHAIEWADTNAYMAVLEEARANHNSCNNPEEHLRVALKFVEAALTVYNPEHSPYNFDQASERRDRIQGRLTCYTI